jgi:hypothetical protein
MVAPDSFAIFVKKNVGDEINRPNPSLPQEILSVIFNQTNDHFTFSSVMSLDKMYRSIYNTNDRWKKMTYLCFSEELIKLSKHFVDDSAAIQQSKKAQRKLRQISWKEIYKDIYGLLQYSMVLSSSQTNQAIYRRERESKPLTWTDLYQLMHEKKREFPFIPHQCAHCHQYHNKNFDPKETREEHEWMHCGCPNCDADSWHGCPYYDDYICW